MLDILTALLRALASTLRTRHDLALENLALRQQLIVAKRHMKRTGRICRLSNSAEPPDARFVNETVRICASRISAPLEPV